MQTKPYANTFNFEGKRYTFFISNENDAIQKIHLQNELFDVAELKKMAQEIEDGELIVDIGANVGNHAIYFAKNFPGSEILVFEPNKEAINILKNNIAANNCSNIEQKFVGTGLSNLDTKGLSQRGGPNNLGGSSVLLGKEIKNIRRPARKLFNEIQLTTGDKLLGNYYPAFIKIDVEGHEFEVLEGLEHTIKRCRPKLFIEIQNSNSDKFDDWLNQNKYTIIWVDKHYLKVTNFLIKPNENIT